MFIYFHINYLPLILILFYIFPFNIPGCVYGLKLFGLWVSEIYSGSLLKNQEMYDKTKAVAHEPQRKIVMQALERTELRRY